MGRLPYAPQIFCDTDQDCWGDVEYCTASPACPNPASGCCVQKPTNKSQPKNGNPPLARNAQLSPEVRREKCTVAAE